MGQLAAKALRENKMAKKGKKLKSEVGGQLGGHDQSRSAPNPGRPTETKAAYNLEATPLPDGSISGLDATLTPAEFLAPHKDGEQISMGHDRPDKISKKYKTKAPR